MNKSNKKGQISLNEAPALVMIVGFIFLIMATIAYVSETYEGALPLKSYTVHNETLTVLNNTNNYVTSVGQCQFQTFAVVRLQNNSATAETYSSGNYTIDATAGWIKNAAAGDVNGTAPNITYTYKRAGTACNVTTSLNTELSSNTSIAGIVLTIALVGIVLSVLIGVFVMSRRKGL